VAKHFNNFMRQRYERVVDFVKMHYCLTQRTDTAFWRDNTDPLTMSATLRDQLSMWRSRAPNRLDFLTDLEMYPPSSWQYVLYGMEFKTDLQANLAAYPRGAQAQQEFQNIRHVSVQALADLPPHRALVEHLCARASHTGGSVKLRA
jgi:tryptophan halogenase